MVRVAAALVSAPPSELTLSPSLVVVAAPAPAPPQLFRKGSELKITLLSLCPLLPTKARAHEISKCNVSADFGSPLNTLLLYGIWREIDLCFLFLSRTTAVVARFFTLDSLAYLQREGGGCCLAAMALWLRRGGLKP